LNTPGSGTPRLAADSGERGLIARIRHRLPPAPPELVVGPGDDAAVVRPDRGALQILTTDALVEGVHFDLRFSSPADVGHKALAVNLSDIAAMGGVPRFALLSLMLPASCTLDAVDQLLDGLFALAGRSRVTVAGGNIARSPGPLVVDMAVTGAAKVRKVLTRSGGRAGDRLYVSGRIGAAKAGLEWLRSRTSAEALQLTADAGLDECVAHHRRPEPRSRLGALLGRARAASACMDLSDGLADAVRQMAEASGTGAKIESAGLPIHPAAAAWFREHDADPVDRALEGGDDYELLFAVPARFKGRFRAVTRLVHGLSLTHIGELTSERSIRLVRDGVDVELPGGFVHF
jgi:thiamine-monophosphate kinase